MTKAKSNFTIVRKQILLCLRSYWHSLVVVATIIFWSPLLIVFPSRPMSCAYVILVMYSLWLLGVQNSFCVSLMPIVFLPLLKVSHTPAVCHSFCRNIIAMRIIVGITSVALENSNLPRRIILRMLRACKPDPRMYMLSLQWSTLIIGLIGSPTTAFLMSMTLIDNLLEDKDLKTKADSVEPPDKSVAASHSMTEKTSKDENENEYKKLETEISSAPFLFGDVQSNTFKQMVEDKMFRGSSLSTSDKHTSTLSATSGPTADKLTCALMTSISFTMTLSNICCFYSSSPLLLMYEYASMLYNFYAIISFARWIVFIFPVVLLGMIFNWLWIQIIFFGFKITFRRREISAILDDDTNTYLREKIISMNGALGPMSACEILFLLLLSLRYLLLWTFEDAGTYFTEWKINALPIRLEMVTMGYATAILLFIIPRQTDFWWKNLEDEKFDEVGESLAGWRDIRDRLTSTFTSITLEIGAAIALMDAAVDSGLYHLLVNELKTPVRFVPKFVLCLLVSITASIFTSFVNVSIAALVFLPPVFVLGEAYSVNPLYFVIPATAMLSVSCLIFTRSSSSALLYESSGWSLNQMIITGIVTTGLFYFIVMASFFTVGNWIFQLDEMPHWYYNVVKTPFKSCPEGAVFKRCI